METKNEEDEIGMEEGRWKGGAKLFVEMSGMNTKSIYYIPVLLQEHHLY